MSRLIDAEICRRRISDERTDDKRWNEALNRACRIVCEQPTVDAVPVVHARWILDEDPHDGDCRCSHCFIAIEQMHERHHGVLNALTGGKWWTYYNYCPLCGAKMDEVTE